MITTTHIVETDHQGGFYVRTPAGELFADDRGVVVYDSFADASEVAEAMTEGRPIRSASTVLVTVDPLTVSITDGDRVLYAGSLTEYHGLVFRVYDSECRDDCGGYELDEPNDGTHVQLSHVRRQSITLAHP